MTQKQRSQQLYKLVLKLPSGKTREVHVRASTLAVAHRRALKRNPGAIGIEKN